ncbi:MAG: hypothetical protein BWX63_02245 [Bacteroidetes bacterium ADurb.Bin041]|jgi:hypothetical protein|nr:MAG: hypothetical protein BWX63_02245 [Bacteroidetes bacterium ADurb.Bin041]
MIPLDIRREMVDREEGQMSICYPCELLGIARIITITMKSGIILP